MSPQKMTKFQLISDMRNWIERLSLFLSEDRPTLSLEDSEIAAFAELANAVKLKIEQRGLSVDWAQYLALEHIVAPASSKFSAEEINTEDAATMIALFRKLIGVLSFAILWFGETDTDGTMIFDAAPKGLWAVSDEAAGSGL